MDSDKDRIEAIRDDYDHVAGAYAEAMSNELDHKPFDRELLHRFASACQGSICEIGCGPGQVARFLHDAGSQVFGIDLSPAMIEQARRLTPAIEFRVGNMLSLEIPDIELAGIAAFYAIVNLTPELRRQAFREMARVLEPGGLLLLAFHISGQMLRELLGRSITMDFYVLDRSVIESELHAVGFNILESIERDPYPPPVEHQSRRAYIIAQKHS